MNTPFLLAMNTAEGVLQLVLGEDTPQGARLAWSETLPAASQGVELLAPALERGLAAVGAKPSQIRRIACVAGPGGFTGLRLASATAAGLAAATGALQAGLPLLPLLAESAAESLGLDAGIVAVLTHARRNLVHLQVFRLENGRAHAVTEIEVLDPASAVRRAVEIDAGAVLLGSGLTRNPQAVEGREARVLGQEFNLPLPAVLLRLADRSTFGPEPVAPLYVRPSDAEENLPTLAAGLGLNPDDAAAALRAFGADTSGPRS